MVDGHPPAKPDAPRSADNDAATLLARFHELRHDEGVVYAGDDPMVRAWLTLALTVDRRLREVVEQQARTATALERLVGADLGDVLRALRGEDG